MLHGRTQLVLIPKTKKKKKQPTNQLTRMQKPHEYDEAVKPPNAPDATYVQVDTVPAEMAKGSLPPSTQPAPQSPPQGAISTGEWASGLCGCFDFLVPNCLMAWCCPCVTFAQISHRLRLTSYFTALLFFCIVVLGISAGCWSKNTLLSIICLVCWILQTAAIMYIRRHIRERFHIDGDSGSDCCIACCCSCCAAAQMATHVKSYRPGDCSFAAPDQLPAYQGA